MQETRLGKLLNLIKLQEALQSEYHLERILNDVHIEVVDKEALTTLYKQVYNILDINLIRSLTNKVNPTINLSDGTKVVFKSDLYKSVIINQTPKHRLIPDRWLRCFVFNRKLTLDKFILRLKESLDYISSNKSCIESFNKYESISFNITYPKSNLTVIINVGKRHSKDDTISFATISTVFPYPKALTLNGFTSKSLFRWEKRKNSRVASRVLLTEYWSRLSPVGDILYEEGEPLGIYYDELLNEYNRYFFEDGAYYRLSSMKNNGIKVIERIINTK